MSKRDDWTTYFMKIASQVATRSTCDRKHVGAVIVRDRNILSSGYNGSVSDLPHCCDVGCVVVNDHCISTIHAEANAIIQAAKHGVAIDGASIYVTTLPCWSCFKLIANSGIKHIFYEEAYGQDDITEVANKIGIKITKVEAPSERLKNGF